MNSEVIIQAICQVIGVTKEGLVSRSRKEELVTGRRIFCMIARRETPLSLAKIGECIMRGHSDVIYLIKTGRNYQKHWRSFADAVAECLFRVKELTRRASNGSN